MKLLTSQLFKGLATLLLLLFSSTFLTAQVGIGTTDPKTQLDVDGALSLREGPSLMLTIGNNDDIDLTLGMTEIPFSQYKITNPSAAFNIRSIIPSTGSDGQIVTFINATDFPMTISHNVSATVPNRIFCPGETDLVIADKYASVTLQYNLSQLQWMVVNYAAASSSGGNDWTILGNSNTTPATNFVGTTNNNALRFRTRNIERFEITDGNLSSGGRLRAFNIGSAAFPIYSWNGDSNTGLYSPGADQLGLVTNGIERFRIPNANQVHALSLGTTALPFYSFSADPNTGLFSPAADNLGLATNGLERIRIDNNGVVGIGTITPATSGGVAINKFAVEGTGTNTGGNITPVAIFHNTGAGAALGVVNSSSANTSFALNVLTSGPNGTAVRALHAPNTGFGTSIDGGSNSSDALGVLGSVPTTGTWLGFGGLFTGGLGYANGLYNLSDERAKRDINKITSSDALERILSINGYTYKYDLQKFNPKSAVDTKTYYGFMAQNVKEFLPNSVVLKKVPFRNENIKSSAANGESGTEELLDVVDYTSIIPILVEAMKEQQTQIEVLKRKIIELENRN